MNYLNHYDTVVDSAYIISLKDNELSQKFTERCVQSCEQVKQPYKIFYGFDGITNPEEEIKVPEQLQGQAFINFLRLHNDEMTKSQIAVFLSHYALWCLCVDIDKPIVILEHDAVMVKPYYYHKYYNNIVYLGSSEQHFHGKEVLSIPPHGSWKSGLYRFICRAHAYAIDPAVAKNLISYTIQQGMVVTLDVIMRSDIFPIIQDGLYAYDHNMGLSTNSEDGVAR